MPDRVGTVYDITAHELSTRTGIHLNGGKTRVWNAAGATPPDFAPLGSNVWVGDRSLPSNEQGLTILCTPCGSPQYVAHQLQHTTESHHSFPECIPALEDLQSSWLLLLSVPALAATTSSAPSPPNTRKSSPCAMTPT